MAYTGLYNAGGQRQINIVPGTSYTGLYSADGKYNGVLTTESTTIKGAYHPCGAFWVTSSDGSKTTAQAPDGSQYVVNTAGGYVFPIFGGTVTPPPPTGLAIDGHVHNSNGGAGSTTLSLSTTQTHDVIVVYVEINGNNIITVTSPTLTFTQRFTAGGANHFYEYWAPAAAVLTNEVIAVATDGNYCSATAFAVSGALDYTNPFDTNGSIPQAANADPVTVSTTAAKTMVIGGFRMGATNNPTAGAGFTAIELNTDYLLTEYQIFSSAQTSLPITVGVGVGTANGAIGDAIVGA